MISKVLPAALAALVGLADTAQAQQVVGGMILPNGQVATGPVFRRDGTSVPQITNGAQANTYINSTSPTLSFVSNAPAAVVLTSVPSTYVRVFTSGTTNAVGGFIAPSNAIRGLNTQQIKDVLALPYTPDSITLVDIPAGTCIVFGTAAPITGNFAANPPNVPTPGPWGNGGVLQGSLIGTASNATCQNPAFLPNANYFNRQGIQGNALAYRNNAGIGNTYAVATALDIGTFPAQFSDMDTIYTALDILNFGNTGSLQAALKQLGGESYADLGYASLLSGRAFLQVAHQQMRAARLRVPGTNAVTASTAAAGNTSIEPALSFTDAPIPTAAMADLKRPFAGLAPGEKRTDQGGLWVTPYGGMGALYGDASTHSTSWSLYGVSGGGDVEVMDNLRVGGTLGYSSAALSTSIPASGSTQAFSAAVYGSYSPGPFYLDAALGYAFNWSNLTRTIAFPGVLRTAQGNPTAGQFLGSAEGGWAFAMSPRLSVTPFARLDIAATGQAAFTESGAGAINLVAQSQSTTGVRSILGVEIGGSVAVAERQDLAMALRLGWAHDYADLSGALTASFAGKPDTSFTVYGPQPDRNAATVGVNLNLPLALGQAFLTYDATLASGFNAHAAMLGLRILF